MGSVYQAKDRRLMRDVAIKVPHEEGDESEESLYYFQREARAAAALQHPGIVSVRNADWIEGRCVIATDLAPDALPTDEATFQVNEEQVDAIAHIEDLDPDEQEELTVELEAGSYVLICNVPTHYDAGMTVAFTVE